jgi:tRNA-dihydrouridine synthase B
MEGFMKIGVSVGAGASTRVNAGADDGGMLTCSNEEVCSNVFEPSGNVFLAPMAGVTDKTFRMICKEFGCALTYTEMVSSKGLFYGSKKTDLMLDIDKTEAPAAVQIFGSDPDIMGEIACRISSDSRVAFIDINMGCPAPKIVKNGEGSALMKTPELAEKIIKNTVLKSLKPVTVKFRKGWDENQVNAVEFAKMAEAAGASAIAIHGRTRAQMYEGDADWNIIKAVKNAVKVPVIGNGDVVSPETAKAIFEHTGCDAIMVGRGALGNPWLFRRINRYLNNGELIPLPTDAEKIDTALRHLDITFALKGKTGLFEMRKQLSWYIKGMKNATAAKNQLNKIEDLEELKNMLLDYKKELMTMS